MSRRKQLHLDLGPEVTQLGNTAGVNSLLFTGEKTETQGKCVTIKVSQLDKGKEIPALWSPGPYSHSAMFFSALLLRKNPEPGR